MVKKWSRFFYNNTIKIRRISVKSNKSANPNGALLPQYCITFQGSAIDFGYPYSGNKNRTCKASIPP